MTPFLLSKDVQIVEIESNEKIDDKYLKSFIHSQLKLNSINFDKNCNIYINYVKNISLYQLFFLRQDKDFFEFEIFAMFYKNIDFVGYELFICEDFFAIFEDKKLFYYQTISQNINENDFVEFLNKKFKININKIRKLDKKELNFLKDEFLKSSSKNIKKFDLKVVNFRSNFSFFIYFAYLLIVIFLAIYFYLQNTTIDLGELNEKDILEYKKSLVFSSLEEQLYEILQNVKANNLYLISFDFVENRAKIVVSSKQKENINIFLEKFSNVSSSSIKFVEEKELFEGFIDVKLSKK